MGIIRQNGEHICLSGAELKKAVNEMRGYTLIAIHCAKSGHSGGSLSAAELMGAAFLNVMNHKPHDPDWVDRDRMYFSVGHKAPIWYTALGYCGYFDLKSTATLRKLHSPFQGHPDANKCKGIEMCCGSLGQGLSSAVGDALASRLDGRKNRIFCLMGDGEQQEGQIWEAAMAAGHYELDNLVGMVDQNRLQIDGWVKDVMNVEPIADKYQSFGWHVIPCDGHDVDDVLRAFKEAEETKGKPSVLIAQTVKGKGVSFMEDIAGWHGKAPNTEELDKALEELDLGYLPKQEMIDLANRYQEDQMAILEKTVPRFSRNYWWNESDVMRVEMEPTRMGFGKSLSETKNPNVVALGADISGSICISKFYENDDEKKSRFFSMGIAEQSGTVVAAGLAKNGKIPFFGTYGVFAAGRALDQLRTTVAYGHMNVKIAGAHGGVSVGPDGATHQALEEIFQIAGLPDMMLYVPADSIETKKCTDHSIDTFGPAYIRFAREATPVVTREETPYRFGEATIITYQGEKPEFIDAFEVELSSQFSGSGEDISLLACGPEVPEAMRAAWILKEEFDISARVINMSTLKPLDTRAIVQSARDTGAVLTIEEHQKGGLGNLVSSAILCSDELYGKPVLFDMIGVPDTFGLSGQAWELIKYFGLAAEHIAQKAREMVESKL